MLNLQMTERHCPVCDNADETRVFAEANVDPQKFGAFAFASRKTPEYMHWRLVSCPKCDLPLRQPHATAGRSGYRLPGRCIR